ncbi:MAG: D-alanyl-D-alanine endopeptidase [Burkholderiales bacterium]
MAFQVIAVIVAVVLATLESAVVSVASAQELRPATQLQSLPQHNSLANPGAPNSAAVNPASLTPALHPTAKLALKSSAAVVIDQATGEILYGKNSQTIHPIASISKLMTAMVVLDAQLPFEELIVVSDEDVDYLRNTGSRLHLGAALSRDEMLRLALMASENRAAAALSRAYPGGREAFIRAMNEKAISLGLLGTRFADSTGLSSTNVSTAEDLASLVAHAHGYGKIREYSTMQQHDTEVAGRKLAFRNTNGLVASPSWGIGLSKTGFINEAGRCLVMQAQLAGRGVIIVLLDSWGKNTRSADALRVRQWLEAASGIKPPSVTRAAPRKPTTSKTVKKSAAAQPVAQPAQVAKTGEQPGAAQKLRKEASRMPPRPT